MKPKIKTVFYPTASLCTVPYKKTGVKKGRFSKLVNLECLMIYQTLSPHDSLRVKAYLISISIKLKV